MKIIKILTLGILVLLFICLTGCSSSKYPHESKSKERKTCFFIGGDSVSPIYFASNTPVVMADKSLKEIKDISEGEKVMGYDLRRGKSIALEVIKCVCIFCENNFLLNESIKANCKQPFYSTTWYPFKSRCILDDPKTLLGDIDGDLNTLEEIDIKNIEEIAQCDFYYDLKFTNTHTYFVVDKSGDHYLVRTCALPSIDCIYGGWN